MLIHSNAIVFFCLLIVSLKRPVVGDMDIITLAIEALELSALQLQRKCYPLSTSGLLETNLLEHITTCSEEILCQSNFPR